MKKTQCTWFPLVLTLATTQAAHVLAQEQPPVTSEAETAPSAEAPPKSDQRTAKNVLYVELLGNGGIYSLNYERFVSDDVSLRFGFDYFSLSASSGTESASVTVLFIPIMVNYFGVGSGPHKLELGIGALPVYASGEASGVGGTSGGQGMGIAGTATVGYRYVPPDGGFNFKIGFTPIFGAGGFLPWGGIGAGAVF